MKVPVRFCSLIIIYSIVLSCGSLSTNDRTQREAPREMKKSSSKISTNNEFIPLHDISGKKDKNGSLTDKSKDKGIKTWKRSRLVPNTAKLMIGDKEQLELKSMQTKITISGFRARVLIDCLYYNDKARNYEGTFKLRLPNEASPYFFAFGKTAYKADISLNKQQALYTRKQIRNMQQDPHSIMQQRKTYWKAPREARMVPKEKAAFAYHDTVRRRIDPALMEWSGAGIFSARVFPLEAKTIHRIVIGYDVTLIKAGNDNVYHFDVPETKADTIVDVIIENYTHGKVLHSVSPKIKGFSSSRNTMYRFKKISGKTIKVRLQNPGVILLTSEDKQTGHYFATQFQPRIRAKKMPNKATRAVFMVDTSLSSNPDKFNIWLKLMSSILKNNPKTIRTFNVLFFNIEQHWWNNTFVSNNKKNRTALLKYANSLVLEGATDLFSALTESVQPARGQQKQKYDIFLLSDGAATWGEDNHHMLLKVLNDNLDGSLFAYKTGLAGSNSNVLNQLTARTGGALFSVAGEAEISKASVAHNITPYQLLSATINGSSEVLVAGNPATIYPNQNLYLTGRWNRKLPAKQVITLKLRNKQGKVRLLKQKITHTISTKLAVRSYGQTAVNQLENLASATEDYSKAYATHFRITGKTCSLLMLESEADYQRYNIRPRENASIIKKHPVASLISSIIRQIGDSLSNPRVRFLHWLGKMKKMPGSRFKTDSAFTSALEQIPDSSFIVKTRKISCRARYRKEISKKLLKLLDTEKLDYDSISKAATARSKQYGPADTLRLLSSLIEKNPGDIVLTRDISFSAMELGFGGHAYYLLRKVAESRPYEPQTYHAIAQILTELGAIDLAISFYEIALSGNWDSRFGDFRTIVVLDYSSFLRKIRNGTYKTNVYNFAINRLERLSKNTKLKKADLMITIMWNTDNSDVDLHVIDPTGEECYYSHRNTKIGGSITRDVTQGYGPEMFTLPEAINGDYIVKVKYFAKVRNRASARTKVYVTIYRDWGGRQEQVQKKVVALEYNKSMHRVAQITIRGKRQYKK